MFADFFAGLGQFSALQLSILCLCAMLVGISKTGVPGISIVNVPLLAIFFAPTMATGLLLPLLAFTDLFAVAYFHRHAQWKHVLRLLPWAVTGILIGSILIKWVLGNTELGPIIGIIVLIMLAVNYWRSQNLTDESRLPHHWAFAALMGFFAGLTTQLANAAGPIMVIYLLAMGLDKHKFMGTAAWYFLILNYFKIPLFIFEGRITVLSFKADLIAFPFIIIGVLLGIFIFKKIPQKWFNAAVQILAVLASLKLIASAFGI